MKYIFLIGFLLFCGSCATVSVTYTFDPEADFSLIKTFGWSGADEGKSHELTIKQVKHALSGQLEAKGFRLSSDNPDMLIDVGVRREKRADTESWGYEYGGFDLAGYRQGVDTFTYEVLTVMLKFVDARKESLIWSGTVSDIVDPVRPA